MLPSRCSDRPSQPSYAKEDQFVTIWTSVEYHRGGHRERGDAQHSIDIRVQGTYIYGLPDIWASLQHYTDRTQEQQLPIFVSSINSAACVTISGPGNALQRFVESGLPRKCSTKSTNIHSLYHEKTHGPAHSAIVLKEVSARNLTFPSTSSLLVPLLSTVDGSTITSGYSEDGSDLLRLVLEMTLSAPTNWMAVQETLLDITTHGTPDSPIAIWNYGPGYGALTRHEYSNSGVEVRDVSQWAGPNSRTENDIAIVGVGIDLPGAPDMDKLWQNLINGINSCSEVFGHKND